jgi:mRNA-degrading endonuclease HigB of HigAB toxin-antitoxin module
MSSGSKTNNKYLQNTEKALKELKDQITNSKKKIPNNTKSSSPKSKQQVLEKYIHFA